MLFSVCIPLFGGYLIGRLAVYYGMGGVLMYVAAGALITISLLFFASLLSRGRRKFERHGRLFLSCITSSVAATLLFT